MSRLVDSASAGTRAARRRFVVGLTGGIGSGKSTVAARFAALGVAVVDADAVAHQMTAPGGAAIPAIRSAFGDAAIGGDGAMDRARMRALVFERPQARAELESILHPLIRAETARQVAAATSPYCILMVPLLVEAAGRDPEHWRDRYDRILVADCREETQIRRVMARNGLDEATVRRIMDAQVSRAKRLEHADDVIDNEGEQSALDRQVAHLHARYLALAAQRDG
ncbi:MAG: dephospho-CoA kinase [Burkholderiales bacterium]|nr:dephospho-CoA kinase [Burkholderiales bacterium]